MQICQSLARTGDDVERLIKSLNRLPLEVHVLLNWLSDCSLWRVDPQTVEAAVRSSRSSDAATAEAVGGTLQRINWLRLSGHAQSQMVDKTTKCSPPSVSPKVRNTIVRLRYLRPLHVAVTVSWYCVSACSPPRMTPSLFPATTATTL